MPHWEAILHCKYRLVHPLLRRLLQWRPCRGGGAVSNHYSKSVSVAVGEAVAHPGSQLSTCRGQARELRRTHARAGSCVMVSQRPAGLHMRRRRRCAADPSSFPRLVMIHNSRSEVSSDSLAPQCHLIWPWLVSRLDKLSWTHVHTRRDCLSPCAVHDTRSSVHVLRETNTQSARRPAMWCR
ncbi:hypothetical protein LZ30DRAFT_743898 [Colletotrichum cereale]|nr:hypothetical protein LZ30DRAFT_743898 [Colletotrichum cereale]